MNFKKPNEYKLKQSFTVICVKYGRDIILISRVHKKTFKGQYAGNVRPEFVNISRKSEISYSAIFFCAKCKLGERFRGCTGVSKLQIRGTLSSHIVWLQRETLIKLQVCGWGKEPCMLFTNSQIFTHGKNKEKTNAFLTERLLLPI